MSGGGGPIGYPPEDVDRDRFDAVGWRILFLVETDLAGKAEIHCPLG